MKRHVSLVGMMGCGKTLIGGILARKLNVPLVDTDREIEIAEERSIAEVFASAGEAYFRDCEHRVLASAVSSKPCVIATGGGSYVFARNRRLIDESGVAVFLSTAPEILWKRIGADPATGGQRPGAKSWKTLDDFRRVLEERDPCYNLANVTVRTSRYSSPEAVATAVWLKVKAHVQLELMD